MSGSPYTKPGFASDAGRSYRFYKRTPAAAVAADFLCGFRVVLLTVDNLLHFGTSVHILAFTSSTALSKIA